MIVSMSDLICSAAQASSGEVENTVFVNVGADAADSKYSVGELVYGHHCNFGALADSYFNERVR
jgi:hypothetical protein